MLLTIAQSLGSDFLFYPFFICALLSVLLTFKLRFIQLRTLPKMFKMLIFNKVDGRVQAEQSVSPRSALFIVLSTTIGMANIAGPIVAMGMGGPGAMCGFLLASFFGAASTFWEVFLAVKYRKYEGGSFVGGPMQYLQKEFHVVLAYVYAFFTFCLLFMWSANQANSLSVLLEPAGVSRFLTGIILALLVVFVLYGGISVIGKINDFMVPIMFVLYCISTLAIICINYKNLPNALHMIFYAPFSASGAFGFASGFSLQSIARSGMARAVQTNEIGLGTATFPHSSANVENPYFQSVLSMVAVYANAFLAMLTTLTVLVSDFWKIPGIRFDISMFYKIMEYYFPFFGSKILMLCGVLFAFGTVLGNSYNASQCYLFLNKRFSFVWFYLLCAITIVWGAIADVSATWILTDYFVLPVAVPHMIAILVLAFRKDEMFKKSV